MVPEASWKDSGGGGAGVNVFLTGASGFLGSRVLSRLLRDGRRVAVLLRPSSDLWRISQNLQAVTPVMGDLKEPSSYAEALARFEPDTLIHLAWWGVQNQHRDDPHQVANLGATLALLEKAAASGVRHFIGLGSQAEYGPSKNVIDENAPTRPTTVYGVTKLATGLLGEQFCRRVGIRFAWLRIFSSYGAGDDPSWLIPSTALSLLRGERPALTKGEQLWDFVHVDDVAAAICAVADTCEAAGVFNVGSGTVATIRSIVERLRDLVTPGAPLGFGELPYRVDQVMHLQADIQRLTMATGWKPKISLAEGLQQTVEWFREHRDRYN
jgi:UDP-glucose 4-epimerase